MTKQQILQEIRRISAANGGKSPGRLTFYKATGVSESDWSGKYWSRWSNAVREAGLSPNQMTAGYDQSFLIEKIIEVTQEIGRFPVSRELRLKAFNQRGFPSTKTFEAHFGSKRQLASKVADYCRKKGGLDDVIRFCEIVALSNKEEGVSENYVESETEIGVVYLIKAGRYYKIGKTKSVGRRVYDLAIQLAEKPATVHVIKTDDPSGIESYWHKRFAHKRMNGEWFDLNASDVRAFKLWLRIV
jgi:hypothetical protein